jgi:hypothetical protein
LDPKGWIPGASIYKYFIFILQCFKTTTIAFPQLVFQTVIKNSFHCSLCLTLDPQATGPIDRRFESTFMYFNDISCHLHLDFQAGVHENKSKMFPHCCIILNFGYPEFRPSYTLESIFMENLNLNNTMIIHVINNYNSIIGT